jgi:hypothetical protein
MFSFGIRLLQPGVGAFGAIFMKHSRGRSEQEPSASRHWHNQTTPVQTADSGTR